jgi:hypothetical protein
LPSHRRQDAAEPASKMLALRKTKKTPPLIKVNGGQII